MNASYYQLFFHLFIVYSTVQVIRTQNPGVHPDAHPGTHPGSHPEGKDPTNEQVAKLLGYFLQPAQRLRREYSHNSGGHLASGNFGSPKHNWGYFKEVPEREHKRPQGTKSLKITQKPESTLQFHEDERGIFNMNNYGINNDNQRPQNSITYNSPTTTIQPGELSTVASYVVFKHPTTVSQSFKPEIAKIKTIGDESNSTSPKRYIIYLATPSIMTENNNYQPPFRNHQNNYQPSFRNHQTGYSSYQEREVPSKSSNSQMTKTKSNKNAKNLYPNPQGRNPHSYKAEVYNNSKNKKPRFEEDPQVQNVKSTQKSTQKVKEYFDKPLKHKSRHPGKHKSTKHKGTSMGHKNHIKGYGQTDNDKGNTKKSKKTIKCRSQTNCESQNDKSNGRGSTSKISGNGNYKCASLQDGSNKKRKCKTKARPEPRQQIKWSQESGKNHETESLHDGTREQPDYSYSLFYKVGSDNDYSPHNEHNSNPRMNSYHVKQSNGIDKAATSNDLNPYRTSTTNGQYNPYLQTQPFWPIEIQLVSKLQKSNKNDEGNAKISKQKFHPFIPKFVKTRSNEQNVNKKQVINKGKPVVQKERPFKSSSSDHFRAQIHRTDNNNYYDNTNASHDEFRPLIRFQETNGKPEKHENDKKQPTKKLSRSGNKSEVSSDEELLQKHLAVPDKSYKQLPPGEMARNLNGRLHYPPKRVNLNKAICQQRNCVAYPDHRVRHTEGGKNGPQNHYNKLLPGNHVNITNFFSKGTGNQQFIKKNPNKSVNLANIADKQEETEVMLSQNRQKKKQREPIHEEEIEDPNAIDEENEKPSERESKEEYLKNVEDEYPLQDDEEANNEEVDEEYYQDGEDDLFDKDFSDIKSYFEKAHIKSIPSNDFRISNFRSNPRVVEEDRNIAGTLSPTSRKSATEEDKDENSK